MRKRLLYFVTVASMMCVAYGCNSDTMISINSQCSSDDDCNVKGKKGYVCQNNLCHCDSDACKNNETPDKPDKPDDPDKPDKPDDPDKPDEPNDPPISSDEKDLDGDTIPDIYDTCDEDTDGDGKMNCEDEDSDGDTIPDSVEGLLVGDTPADSDYDDIYDFMELDSDNNGIPDSVEVGSDPMNPVDTDGDGTPDFQDDDNDGDSILDTSEIAGIEVDGHPGRKCDGDWCVPGTPDNPWNTDGDAYPDYNDPDNDGDGILDSIELYEDTDNDGVLDIYSLDSNGDGIPDSAGVNPDGSLSSYTNPSTGETVYCYKTKDCDGDALSDSLELNCNGQSTAMNPDFDNDGYLDGSEFAAAQYAKENGLLSGAKISSPEELVCNPNLGVKDVFEFYFELPYGGEQQDDDLPFYPEVKQLDLVFNVDTTGSMMGSINNVKTNISSIISSIKGMVKDSGFALTNFDDFPVNMYGDPSFGDLPFRVLGTISTDVSTVTSYTKNYLFTTRNGLDLAESGAESLYQIATGEGVSWSTGSVPAHPASGNRWGGVDFRKGALPIVIHTTDVYSHDMADSLYVPMVPSNLVYSGSVNNPHYTSQLIPVLKKKGIRVITLSVAPSADMYNQMTVWARESNAIVPACAFEEKCGNNVCCLGTKTTPSTTINGREHQCILTYQTSHSDVSDTIVNGVDALVKYGTYDVATRIRGVPIDNASVDTSCFIKRVEATQYIAPPNEPEHSCNPVAIPNEVGGAGYNNGFTNFAPGTSSADKKGAELHFTVYAQNDNCIKPSNEAQVFTAYIEVYDPTTGLSFGERKVSIIVPPGGGPQIN